MHQAQWKFHTQIMTTKKIHSTIYWWLTCQSGPCTMARIGVQRWSLNHRKRLCDALSFIVHCCTKPSGISRQWIHFIDASGYIRPYDLNNIDIRALCWTQEDINHCIGKKALAYPGLKTTLSAYAWLSMCGSTWSLVMWSVYSCAVRPP